jgi:hypothetical protein
MTHPIVLLQTALVAALRADTAVTAIVAGAIYNAPPRGAAQPSIVVARHDLVPRDGDAAPGSDHRVILHLWHPESSRKAVLALAEAAVSVALTADLPMEDLLLTNRSHERTDTAIDLDTGAARAAVTLRFFTEPTA